MNICGIEMMRVKHSFMDLTYTAFWLDVNNYSQFFFKILLILEDNPSRIRHSARQTFELRRSFIVTERLVTINITHTNTAVAWKLRRVLDAYREI